MNFALFSPTAPQTLLSLGHLHACGGTFITTLNPPILQIRSADGTVLDNSRLLSHSNLYPANLPTLLSVLHKLPHLTAPPLTPPPPGLFPPVLRSFILTHRPHPRKPALIAYDAEVLSTHSTATQTAPDDPTSQQQEPPLTPPTISTDSPSIPTPSPPLPPILSQQLFHHRAQRISLAQYSRVIDAIELHNTQNHPPDDKLCRELATGKHPYTPLTPSDITLMRELVGPCPHCLEGRAFRPASIRRISTTIPASKPGEVISFDPQKLPTTTLGGYTHMITMVDENTGHISQPGIRSKTTPAAFAGIQRIINQTYNANGHKVYTLHGDAERVNTSMSPLLGAIGAKLKVSLPGQHAHRAERTVQTIADRARSVEASLPYFLPPETHLLLKQSVGESLNNSICKASDPLTPNEALSGFKPQRAPVGFGRCALVLQPEDKRRTISTATGIPFKQVPLTELGVSMGLQPGTDRTQWLLANGIVVPRIPIGQLLPQHYVPFNWKLKPITALQLPPSFPSQSPPLPPPPSPSPPHQQQTIQGGHTHHAAETTLSPETKLHFSVDTTTSLVPEDAVPAATTKILPMLPPSPIIPPPNTSPRLY